MRSEYGESVTIGGLIFLSMNMEDKHSSMTALIGGSGEEMPRNLFNYRLDKQADPMLK
jgi:hypothetical protein